MDEIEDILRNGPPADWEHLSAYLSYYQVGIYNLEVYLWENIIRASPYSQEAHTIYQWFTENSLNTADNLTEEIPKLYPDIFDLVHV